MNPSVNDSNLPQQVVEQQRAERQNAKALTLVCAQGLKGSVEESWSLDTAQWMNAALIDAFGCGPGHIPITLTEGLRWADIDPTERAFPVGIESFWPKVGDVPVLGCDARGGVTADHPVLPALLAAVSTRTHCVIDAGLWDDRALTVSKQADIVLYRLGKGKSGVEELSGRLSAWMPSLPVLVIVEGKADPHLRSALRKCLFRPEGGSPRHTVVSAAKSRQQWRRLIETMYHLVEASA